MGTRWYRLLLTLYPRPFRERYGRDMTELFTSRLVRERERGPLAVAGLLVSTLRDTLWSAAAERLTGLPDLVATVLSPSGFAGDLGGAARRLSRAPTTSVITVLLLATGIAGNVALFTVVNTLLVQSPPGVGEPERALEVMAHAPDLGPMSMSYPAFVGLREQVRSLETVAVWNAEPMSIVHDDAGRRLFGMYVSDGYFAALGAPPSRGRDFTRAEAEAVPGAPLAIISERLWRTDFGADPDAVGGTLVVNRVAHTVVGIGAADFRGHMGPIAVDVWVPLSMHPSFAAWRDRASTSWVEGVARLGEGATLDEARVEAAGVFARDRSDISEEAGRVTLDVDPLGSVPAGARPVVTAFVSMLMAFGLLALLVLCTNVGGLVLARGMAREREIAVRLALGAGRGRVVRQFLVESTLLAGLGAAAGGWLALYGLEVAQGAVLPLLPVPVSLQLALGAPVLVFTATVAALTVAVTGVAPALRLVGDDLVVGIKGSGAGGVSAATGRARRVLVGGQLAVSTLLLAVAALFVRSLQEAGSLEVGFESADVWVATINLEAEGYGEAAVGLPVLDRMRDAVGALPGVEHAALTTDVPMDFGGSVTGVRREDAPDETAWTRVGQAQVGPGYFDVLGIPLVAGRDIDERDREGTENVVVVNRALAERLWPAADPIGGRLMVSMGDEAPSPHTVIGVVGNVLSEVTADPGQPTVYGALTQHYRSDVEILARARGAGTAVAGAMRGALLSVDPWLSEGPVRPLTSITALGTLPQRVAGGVAGAFGILTVVLAAVGLYGTIAYEVGRRRREIGVRMALGARQRSVVGSVLRDTLGLTVPGVLVGLVGALAVGRVARALLLGVGSADPLAMTGVLVAVTLLVAAATWVPARSAARVAPAEALRHE